MVLWFDEDPDNVNYKYVRTNVILDLPRRHSVNCDISKSLNMLNMEHRVKQKRFNHVEYSTWQSSFIYEKKFNFSII